MQDDAASGHDVLEASIGGGDMNRMLRASAVVVLCLGLGGIMQIAPASAEIGLVTGVRGGGDWSGTGQWEQQFCEAFPAGCSEWQVFNGPTTGSINLQIGCMFICVGSVVLLDGPNVITPFFFGTARKAAGLYYVSGSAYYPPFSFVRVNMTVNPNGSFTVVRGARTQIGTGGLPLDSWTNYRGPAAFTGTLTSGAFNLSSV